MLPVIEGYQATELLSEGKYNWIFRARRYSDDKIVILKFIKPEYNLDSNIKKLVGEFELLNKLKSDYIIKAYDLVTTKDYTMLVMENFPSKTLDHYIRHNHLDLVAKLEISIQLANALGEIHQGHIIHKDIKPRNILIDIKTKKIKIIDFSLSTYLSREVESIVNPEEVEGTIAFMSPEQTGRINRVLDYRSDIYSLGVTLYLLFTGELPFIAANPMELIHQHIAQEPVPPNEKDPKIFASLSNIILKCMAKQAEYRYRSVFGLKKDLEKCYNHLKTDKTIPPFIPGEEDVYDHFHFPDKLYGRQQELNFIKNLYKDVCRGSTILLTVTGYSGIGKSSLINEAQKTIFQENVYFTKSNFEQFKGSPPYHGLINAFQHLIHQILSESDHSLEEWKEKILTAVGENGQVIIDVIPDVKLIIGPQNPVEQLNPQENEFRFKNTILNFLKVLTSKKPLVIFIENLQWSDPFTLKLLELFVTKPSIQNLFIIAAYRNNEVDALHPLTFCLKDIQNSGGKVVNLEQKPLTLDSVQELIQEVFRLPNEQKEILSKHAFQKTQGNPLFTIQFLKYLYEEGLFNFDEKACCWRAKMDEISKTQVSDNVADLLSNKLQRMKPHVQEVLKVGAAIGEKFDVETLVKVMELPKEQVLGALQEALEEDFIDLFTNQPHSLKINSPNKYRFSHTRIHQTAYASISPEILHNLHYRIGRVLLNSTSSENMKEMCMDITDQLNLGIHQSLSKKEKEELSKLNLMSGLKAKETAAYSAAAPYFAKGIELLEKESWDTQRNLTLSLYENLAICFQLIGEFKKSLDLLNTCLKKATNIHETASLYSSIIFIYSQNQNYEKVFEIAKEALNYFGFSFEMNPSRFTLTKDLLKLKFKLKFWTLEKLQNLSPATNPNIQAVCTLLTSLLYPAYATGRKYLYVTMGLKVVQLTLEYGMMKESAPALLTYASALTTDLLNDYETGYQYGLEALKLAQRRFPKTLDTANAISLYYIFINRWKNPMRTSILPLRKNYNSLLEKGGTTLAGSCLIHIYYFSLACTDSLEKFLENINRDIQEMSKMSSIAEEMSLLILREYCLVLQGTKENSIDPRPKQLTDELLQKSKTYHHLGYPLRYEIRHLSLLYLFGKYAEANQIGRNILPFKDNYLNWIEWPNYYFFHALTLAALIKLPNENSEEWSLLNEHYKTLSNWGRIAPVNYAHLAELVAAEIARISQDGEKAKMAYEKAVTLAKQNEFYIDLAICYELYAQYLMGKTQNEMAGFYLHKAMETYHRLGIYAKFKHLQLKYGDLLKTASFIPIQTQATVIQKMFKPTAIKADDSSRSGETQFDVNTIVNAAQTISKEIVLEKLIESLMQILIVSAGADKAFLILMEKDKPLIYAETYLNQPYQPLENPLHLEDRKDNLCLPIVRYVIRSRIELLLNDAIEEGNFTKDPYILNKKPKSILCLPLIQKNVLVGLLYLENTATKGAFTAKRVHLLSMLSSQMAISIENAQFYATLEQRVQDRTKELQETLQTLRQIQNQMIQQEKMAALGSLTTGIAHELKNPLNFVINFSQIARESLGVLTQEIKKKIEDGDTLQLIKELDEYIEKIESHGERADNIIKGMLAHAHQGSENPEKVQINSLIEQALNLVFHSYRRKDPRFNVTIKKNYDETIEPLDAFQGDLLRVFINILDNACYAILEKILSNPNQYVPSIEVATKEENGQVVVKIKDNGPGIPKSVVDKIFQPFFTTKPVGSGTGLGLSIVNDMVVKHGGTITVDSEPGKFTEFVIQLPLRQVVGKV